MSNPQDPNQWAQQGWQQPAQPQPDQTQIAPQFGGQPQFGTPPAQPGAEQTQIAPQYQAQWPGQQQPQQTQQFGGYQQPGQPQFGQEFAQPPLAAQQFGQQFGQPAPKKQKTGLIIGGAAVAVIAIVAIVLGVLYAQGKIFSSKLDNAKVNAGVTEILEKNYQEPDTKDVSCETDGVKVEADATFNCTATIGGKQKTITVKVLNKDGDYQVGAPS